MIASLREIFILDPIPSHMRKFSPLSDKLEPDASNVAGVLAALSKEKQQEIEAVLTRYASQLPERDIRRVYAETVGSLFKRLATRHGLDSEGPWGAEAPTTFTRPGAAAGVMSTGTSTNPAATGTGNARSSTAKRQLTLF